MAGASIYGKDTQTGMLYRWMLAHLGERVDLDMIEEVAHTRASNTIVSQVRSQIPVEYSIEHDQEREGRRVVKAMYRLVRRSAARKPVAPVASSGQGRLFGGGVQVL